MKIFFPLEVFYPSQAGGPANSIYWMVKNLAKHGFEPIIVATDKGLKPDFPLNRWIESEVGKAIYIKTRFLDFPFYQTIISFLNFSKADVVHISSFFFPTAFATAFAARLLKKKIVWSARGELDGPALKYSRQRKRPILWFIKKTIGDYPVFHSTCDEETQSIKNIFGDNIKVVQIPNYIEIPPMAVRSPGRYLLYLGRIHPKKAIDNLIRGLAISDAFLQSDFVLKIAGTGKPKFEIDLQELVSDLNMDGKIIFAGQVEGEEKHKLLADAYFTIMPSHTENFGMVVLESLAQNTPVLASKGSPWEILEKEQIGFWTENSPESLARAIDRLLRMDKSEYEAFRQRGRDFVIREFDIRENIGKWIEVYRNLR
jgi:glycosyltransferase involved in cell wall biosynthesis